LGVRQLAALANPTLADAIPDRLLRNAYKLELNGESSRKGRAQADERRED
jgi:hypothetical protein